MPASVQAITPLIGQILVASESDHSPADALPPAPSDFGEANRTGRGGAAELHLFYNRPSSGAVYAPVTQRLLPLDDTWRRQRAELAWPTPILPEIMGGRATTLRALVREYLFVSLFRACAESLASENASRLAAMQRADKNIDELLEDLKGKFHRRRQSGIDEELFDVISGFEALTAPRRQGRHEAGATGERFVELPDGARDRSASSRKTTGPWHPVEGDRLREPRVEQPPQPVTAEPGSES